MNYEEFGFLNQQLASMLRDGIPLEGALAQLCQSMRRGRLRSELELLGDDLSRGTPLDEALAARRLPRLYAQLVRVGAKSNDLPGVLVLLADHYRRLSSVRRRLTGLLVYPLIVLLLSLGLSAFLAFVLFPMVQELLSGLTGSGVMLPRGVVLSAINVAAPPVAMVLALVVLLVALGVPALRRKLRWRLPPFKQASLAQLASALAALLRGGCTLDDSLAMAEALEEGTPAEAEVARWRARLAQGYGQFADMTLGGRVFPPFFVWLVDSARDEMAAGFDQAAEIYAARAEHRIEMVLYGVLPVTVLLLGSMVLAQVASLGGMLAQFLQMLGSV